MSLLAKSATVADMLAKKVLVKIDPAKFDPRNRAMLEVILNAERMAILRNLLLKSTTKVLDDKIGQN